MFNIPDLRFLFWWALFGMACSALLAVGGIGWLVWWLINHVQFV